MKRRNGGSPQHAAATLEGATTLGARVAEPSDNDLDALSQFQNESRMTRAFARARSRNVPNWLVWVLIIGTGAQLWIVVPWLMNRSGYAAAQASTVIVESSPAGAQVRIDSRASGVTPMRLSVAPGDRILEVAYENTVRRFPITVQPGEIVRQRIDFIAAPTAQAAPARSAIAVTTDGASAAVSVDRINRGRSPVLVSDLDPGEHAVTVTFATGTVERTIRVEGGGTTSLAVTMPPAASASASPASGWIRVEAQEPLRIVEDGKLIGTSEVDRLMLPAGAHTLDLVNDDLGFSTRRLVAVKGGATTAVTVPLPVASLAINAQPWADVWLDGQPVGATPIGAVSTRIGHHELTFRHPQYGERRSSVVVTLQRPARIGVDLRTNN